jgi:hypothetical protein
MHPSGAQRRRERIQEAPKLDLKAQRVLAADYEAANMPCATAELGRRLKHYRERTMITVM